MTTLHTFWHHLRRSPFQSLAALFSLSISFFLGTTLFWVILGANQTINYYQTRPEITIYLKDGIDQNATESLQKELSNFTGVREIRYISKDQALEAYRQLNQNDPLITGMIKSSFLPASFEVTASHPQVLDQIVTNLTGKTTLIDEIIYQKTEIDQLLSWLGLIRQAGIIVTIVTLAYGLLVVFSIVSLKFVVKKDEIKIIRLLGGSRLYAAKPFLYESIFYGTASSIIGFIGSTLILNHYSPTINTYFYPNHFFPTGIINYLWSFPIFLFAGFLLGYALGSLITKRLQKI